MTPTSSELPSILEQAARIATQYLEENRDRSLPVVRYLPPEQLAKQLQLSIPERGRSLGGLMADVEKVLTFSVRTGHPRFLNQLFGGHDTAAILGEWMTALVNTSMYTYESAPVATLMELALIEKMCRSVGFEDGEGVFAPGGSISNLMAVLAARHHAFPHVRQEGLRAGERPVMFLSEEAHYSLSRAAVVAGIGLEGAVLVRTDEVGRMLPDELERAIETAQRKGRRPFLVAATAGTTVPGAFDPLNAIADVAERHGLWMHVDASFGGTVLLSRKHRRFMDGVERADSVTWNPHKMMGMPLLCSATLMREKGRLAATNRMDADYLFHGAEGNSIDLGDMSLQCGRRVDALKLWFSWQALGDEGYEQRVDRLFILAAEFTQVIRRREGFLLVREPEGTNICFRYVPESLRNLKGSERLARENEATLRIRERLARGGRFLVNFATLDGAASFRLVTTNPATTFADLEALLDEIERIGCELYAEVRVP